MNNKYFPIKTATACQNKWAWSTLYLNIGVTKSCHRTCSSDLTEENFFNFHNAPNKIEDRKLMLEGQWPESNCGYCKNIEQAGGISDRIRVSSIPNLTPSELELNPTATIISPTILEVYFNNTCNLSCLYCDAFLSSVIEKENRKFGRFEKGGVVINEPEPNRFKDLVPLFWQWMETGFQTLSRLHILGGEPLYQKEFDKLLDYIELYPNPKCELNVVTNLNISQDRLENYIKRFRNLLANRKLKRIDITCSIDCWGAEQEYVRWGLDLPSWEKNFEILLKEKWITLQINQTITALAVKTMPELLKRLQKWRSVRPVGHYFSGAYPAPDYLIIDAFGENFFQEEIHEILNLMPNVTEEDRLAKEYMAGILLQGKGKKFDPKKVKDLMIYLDEMDRRRGCNWRTTFTWLAQIENQLGESQ